MDETTIDTIINNINNNSGLESSIYLFYKLSYEDKLILLNNIAKIKTKEAGRFLNLIYEGEERKDLKKIIRKAIYKLRTVGVEVDEPQEKGEPVLKKYEIKPSHFGYMSNYDQNNEMFAIVGINLKGKDYIIVDGDIDFMEGLTNLNIMPTKKPEFDKIFDRERFNLPKHLTIAEVSPKFASYVINEASIKSGIFREEAKTLYERLKNIQSDIEKPEDIYYLPTPDVVQTISLEDILDHDFFESFLPEWEGMEDDLEKYMDIEKPSIILPPYMIAEKKDNFINSLMESDRIKRLLPHIKRTMENYALIFHFHKEYPYYKALIENLKKDNTTKDIARILIEKTLNMLVEAKEEEEEQTNLIVRPYEEK